jgi:hypothetical protein
VRDLVQLRIDQLPSTHRLVVELVSLGEPLGLDVLTRCAGEEHVLAVEASNLLVAGSEGTVRLWHPLYSEVLRATLGPALRRAHFRRLSEALAAAIATAEPLQLATWSLEGGLPVAVDVLVAGSKSAHAVFDDQNAVRLARAAVEAGGGT